MPSTSSDVTQLSESVFIRAGAGAGKTTQLIKSFSNFVTTYKSKHNKFPKIVITTFTRKATQEVKERLLLNALKNNNQDEFEYINKKSYVQISTIHGLLNLFLRQNADLLQLPQDLKIVDDFKFQKILKKNIHYLFKKKSEYIELLEVYPFYQLIQICQLALNEKAQSLNFNYIAKIELVKNLNIKKQKILDLIDDVFIRVPVVPDSWTEYFNFLKDYKKLLLNSISNKDSQIQFINEDYFDYLNHEPAKPRFNSKKPAFDPQAHESIEQIRKEYEFNYNDSIEFINKHELLNQLFLNFINELSEINFEYKKKSGELTISDLENLSYYLVQRFPIETKEFSDSWDYYMLDEYQDTSPLQVKILDQLIGLKPFFIVGDPQQSIYLFRGARSEVFLNKEVEIQKSGISTLSLNTNYRSNPDLMCFINDFFNNFSSQFKPMQPKSMPENLQQDKIPTAVENSMIESDTKNEISHVAYFIKTSQQANSALNQIKFFFEQGIDPKSICVLSKKHSSLVELAQLAYQVQIPVQLQSSSNFETQREILDLVAFLKFILNPHDDENLITLLRSPWLFLNDSQIVKIQNTKFQDENIYSLWSKIKFEKLSIYDDLQLYINCFEKIGCSETLKLFINNKGYILFSEFLDSTGRREANIWKFYLNLVKAEKEVGFILNLYLIEQFQSLQNDLASSTAEAAPVIQPDCVTLMTVHASKGLEFDHVIILGMSDQPNTTKVMNFTFDPKSDLFSLACLNLAESKLHSSSWAQELRQQFNEREKSENERLLYVAMTRAKVSITLVAQTEVSQKNENPKAKRIANDSWFKKSAWPEVEKSQNISNTILNINYNFKSWVDNDEFLKSEIVVNKLLVMTQKIQITGNQNEKEKYLQSESKSTETKSTQNSVTQILDANQWILQKDKSGSNSKDILSESEQSEVYQNRIINYSKANKGTRLHQIFESLKYLDLNQLKLQLSDNENRMLDFLLNNKTIDLKKILDCGYNEWGFGLLTGQSTLQGQIDAWAELDDEIHVLDYKTGSPNFSNQAFTQLSIYTFALLKMQKISKDKTIVHSVIYPHEKLIKQNKFLNAEDFTRKTSQLSEMFSF